MRRPYGLRHSGITWRLNSRSVLVDTGATGIRAADVVVVVIGHLPGRAETRGGWASRDPSNSDSPHRRPATVITQRPMGLPKADPAISSTITPIADFAVMMHRPGLRLLALRSPGSGLALPVILGLLCRFGPMLAVAGRVLLMPHCRAGA